MKILYESPYSQSCRRGFPDDIGYLCFEPIQTKNISELVPFVQKVMNNKQQFLVLLRPYKNAGYVSDVHHADTILSSKCAEGYAFVPDDGNGDASLTPYLNDSDDEEAAVAMRFRNSLFCFVHEGHSSIEVLGKRELILKQAAYWLNEE